jgi:hypothetical protein
MGSRILAVADAYEAMTSNRIYRSALTSEEALAELHRFAGSQFDPAIVGVFATAVAPRVAGPRPQEGRDRSQPTEPGGVFGVVAGVLLKRFEQFAGSDLVAAVVDRVRSQAEWHGWTLTWQDGTVEVETPDRQVLPAARRQTLTWLISAVEQLGGRRIAMHLLRESVDDLPEQAREAYQMLLAPQQMEDLVGPPLTRES